MARLRISEMMMRSMKQFLRAILTGFAALSVVAQGGLALAETAQPQLPSGASFVKPALSPGLSPDKHGLTHWYFTDWDGPRVPVWVYIPHTANPKTAPILMMMHGAKRGAARYLSEWDHIADEHGFIVVAPEFNKEDFNSSWRYNHGNVFSDDHQTQNAESDWTFSTLEPIFDHVVQALGSNQKEYTLYGHSAGSQFSHRFMFFKPEARVKRFLLANAGWYTMPDLSAEYPYGLRGVPSAKASLKSALAKDVVLLLGDQDIDTAHGSLNRTAGAMQQGAHRFARGQAFYNAAREQAKEMDVDFIWRMRVVGDVAHSNGGIAAAAGDLVE